jgi:hypothetical protein
MNIAGSVESYVQSSPESDHCDYSMTSTRNYSFIPDMLGYCGANQQQQQEGFHHQNSTGTEGGTSSDLEDHIASQILNEFPEIRSYVGQIIDGNL